MAITCTTLLGSSYAHAKHSIAFNPNEYGSQRDFNRALGYLKKSKTFREAFYQLDLGKRIISINPAPAGHPLSNAYSNGRINWSPTELIACACTGKTQSPAMALAHEIGHAAQDFFGSGAVKLHFLGISSRYSGNYVEMDNIEHFERQVARELGESTRCGHAATRGLGVVNDVLDRGKNNGKVANKVPPHLRNDWFFWDVYRGAADVDAETLASFLPKQQGLPIDSWMLSDSD